MTRSDRQSRPATYADIEALPDNVVGEILDGELYVWPRPRPRHAVAAGAIITDLTATYGRGNGSPGGWWILTEPELHLGRQVIVPDVGGWRRQRLPTIPDEAGIRTPPDWVCEVLSPTTARVDRVKKTRIYAEHGIGHLWIVDPVLRTLEVSELQGGRWCLVAAHEVDDRVRVPPFEEIELDLASWWAPLPGPPTLSEPRADYRPLP